MKKLLPIFFFLLSLGALSAQKLNLRDTNKLLTMLYSTTWIQYELNTDSTFSDKIIDSIRIYPNKTWNNYYRLKRFGWK